MSNRERIARAAEEARLTEAEKAAAKAPEPGEKSVKKTAKKASRSGTKRTAKEVRMKIIWEVISATGASVRTFPYPDKAQAEAETQSLSSSTGRTHILRATKVPMD